VVLRYHDATKHHFNRFSRSLGYLDWAAQPNPFRSFAGTRVFQLPPRSLLRRGPTFITARGAPHFPNAAGTPPPPQLLGASAPRNSSRLPLADANAVSYDRLFEGPLLAPAPVSAEAIGDVLRHSLGLSAWKQYGESRWSLRVNPSSGNLHPTEAYLVTGPVAGLAETAAVYHYAPDRHALEERCAFDAAAWRWSVGEAPLVALVALTSIHWREAWKYGERAFRYCQHDLGHAIAAVRFAAALVGWKAVMVPAWSHREVAALVGVDRDEDYVGAEHEEPACVLALAQSSVESQPSAVGRRDARLVDPPRAVLLVEAVRGGNWVGRANQLSAEHVEWPIVDEVARATSDVGHALEGAPTRQARAGLKTRDDLKTLPYTVHAARDLDARAILLQRRSALAFDGRSSIGRQAFLAMLARTLPGPGAPWDALWWTPRIHLALFVHRVDGVTPGLYVLVRGAGDVRLKADAPDADATSDEMLERLKMAFGREFLWERADERLPLYCLARGDCRPTARRLSCDQEIASDGFFSLGMIAEFAASLEEHGPSFYRHLYWESGVVGQVLYLEAEAAGARATGIGCFYDDPVHEVLGVTGHAFQSLYHFTVGMPVEDSRLRAEPGYEWERLK